MFFLSISGWGLIYIILIKKKRCMLTQNTVWSGVAVGKTSDEEGKNNQSFINLLRLEFLGKYSRFNVFCFKCSLLQNHTMKNLFLIEPLNFSFLLWTWHIRYIHFFKVNNGNTRTVREICSKLTIKKPEWRQTSFWCFYC